MRRFTISIALCLTLLMAVNSQASIVINEVLLEPSGPNFGQQFFELRGAPNQSLDGLSLVVLVGEADGSGIVDQVFDLSAFSLGSNGLFLWRDTPGVLSPAPDPDTTVGSTPLPLGPPAFLANLSQTFLLVSGLTANPTDDLDGNNDGTLDSMHRQKLSRS